MAQFEVLEAALNSVQLAQTVATTWDVDMSGWLIDWAQRYDSS